MLSIGSINLILERENIMESNLLASLTEDAEEGEEIPINKNIPHLNITQIVEFLAEVKKDRYQNVTDGKLIMDMLKEDNPWLANQILNKSYEELLEFLQNATFLDIPKLVEVCCYVFAFGFKDLSLGDMRRLICNIPNQRFVNEDQYVLDV